MTDDASGIGFASALAATVDVGRLSRARVRGGVRPVVGGGIYLLTWWIIAIGGSSTDPTFLGRIYIGYEFAPLGSVIDLVWGAVDALIAGAIFA